MVNIELLSDKQAHEILNQESYRQTSAYWKERAAVSWHNKKTKEATERMEQAVKWEERAAKHERILDSTVPSWRARIAQEEAKEN